MILFGHQMSANDAKECGLVSQVFPHATFEQEVWSKLKQFVQMPKQVLLTFIQNIRLQQSKHYVHISALSTS
jgi:peroxisomal 3,2-trans-enoyl-CoA isomerase